MAIVVHQPYFLPWMGYFSKLVYANYFIVQDNTFFSKMKYIDRTRIISTNGEIQWLGFPIGQNFKKKINEIDLKNRKNLDIMLETLRHSYNKARHFKDCWPQIKDIITHNIMKTDKLVEVDIGIVVDILKLLGIPIPKIIYLSDLAIDNTLDDTYKLIEICQKIDDREIIMGSGGSVYNHDLQLLNDNKITVLYQDFIGNHPIYYQSRRTRLGFEKGLSIIDCIMNEGIERTRLLLLDSKTIPISIKKLQKEKV